MSDAKQAEQDRKIEEAMTKCLAGKYKKIKPVGRGAYGQVWLVESAADGSKCVAKIMATEKSSRYEQEVQCLAGCSHFAIVGLLDTMTSSVGPIIILEYVDGGDMSNMVKGRVNNKQPPPSEDVIGHYFLCTALSLHHIHANHMMHRDIKAANVMLTSSGMAKMSDFGFSRMFDGTVSADVADTFLGTPYYLAPELWKRQKYSKQADNWSLGVLLYELMTLKKPFTSSSMRGLMQCICNGEFTMPTGYSPELCAVLKGLLTVDTSKRMSMTDLLQQPVMRRYAQSLIAHLADKSNLPKDEQDRIAMTINQQLDSAGKAEVVKAVSQAAKEDGAGDELPVIREGEVQIGSTKDWKPRFIALTEAALNVTRTKADKKKQALELKTISKVTPSDDGQEGIFIVALDNGYTVWIKANTNQERDEWMTEIQKWCSLKKSS